MKLIKIASFAIVAVAIAAILFRACFKKIEPGQAGILNKNWGGGLQEKDFTQGYYLALGGLYTWHVMDTTVQTLSMLRPTPGKRTNRTNRTGVFGALKVKSSDGADVTLDITIKYRIQPGAAWKVLKMFGDGNLYQTQVRTRANKTLQLGLGQLNTEQFFDPNYRKSTQSTMEDQLRPRLADMNVELVDILIRDVEFQKSFELKIKAKTLTKQNAELQIAMTKSAEARGNTNEIVAETAAKVIVIKQTLEKDMTEMRAKNDKEIQRITADFEKYVTVTRSEADLYAAQKEALGIKLLKDAEARGQALKRQALSTAGGSMLVALRTVEGLKFDTLSISTQLVNPLDLAEMMKRFGAEK